MHGWGLRRLLIFDPQVLEFCGEAAPDEGGRVVGNPHHRKAGGELLEPLQTLKRCPLVQKTWTLYEVKRDKDKDKPNRVAGRWERHQGRLLQNARSQLGRTLSVTVFCWKHNFANTRYKKCSITLLVFYWNHFQLKWWFVHFLFGIDLKFYHSANLEDPNKRWLQGFVDIWKSGGHDHNLFEGRNETKSMCCLKSWLCIL